MKLLKEIPKEVIINVLEPYTRKCQPRELCEDIINYNTTLNIIFKTYYDNLYSDYGSYVLNSGVVEKVKIKISCLVWYFIELDMLTFMLSHNLLPNISSIINDAYSRVLVQTIQDEYDDYWLLDILKVYKITKKRVCLMWGKLDSTERLNFIKYCLI